jgi:hypothetical protein
MATYSITITFENDKTQEFVINGVEAAYEVFERACALAEVTNSKKVEMWAAEDEDGSRWEQIEEEEF